MRLRLRYAIYETLGEKRTQNADANAAFVRRGYLSPRSVSGRRIGPGARAFHLGQTKDELKLKYDVAVRGPRHRSGDRCVYARR